MDIYCTRNNLQVFSDVLRQMAATRKLQGNILHLEIPLDHVTNFGSIVNGTVWITNPLIWIRILWISNLMNPLSKRIHQIKNPFLNLPKGTRNPFEDLNSVFGFTERNTPLGCVSDARTAPAGKTSLKK